MTLIANINGSTYEDIDLGRDSRTHVNDISTKFKTLAEDGTLWMTNSPSSPDYIKVFLEDGDLKVAINAAGVSTRPKLTHHKTLSRYAVAIYCHDMLSQYTVLICCYDTLS